MYNKILIVNKSSYIGDFLKEKLEKFDIDVIITKNSVDALVKMRNIKPDLIIIDYNILNDVKVNFLKEKHQLKSTVDIPIVIFYSKKDQLNKDMILELAKYRLYKLIQKPIEMDLLFKVIEEILNIRIDIDMNPCLINIDSIDDVLVIKISKGLNLQKIDLMKYKILELMSINEVKYNKILIIMTDIGYQENLDDNLKIFIKNILEPTNIFISSIHLITDINYIKEYFLSHPKYRFIDTTSDLNELLKNINNIEVKNYFKNNEKKNETFSDRKRLNKNTEATLNLNFSSDETTDSFFNSNDLIKDKKFNIAVIDDDLSVLELMEVILLNNNWNVKLYEDGNLFINDLLNNKPDLIFLDLIMPNVNGFEVLEYLELNNIDIPVIVMSSLINKDFIFKARKYGVAYYLTKPVKPNIIIEKAEEVLKNKVFTDGIRKIYKVKDNINNLYNERNMFI